MDVSAFSKPGRFWRGNLHTHSTRSDGRLPPEAVAAFYKDAGYDFLALTDHFWECYGYPVTDTRSLRAKGFTTLPGAEIHAPVTARNHDWHVVAVGLPLDFAPPTEGETMQAMSKRAVAAGAFLAIAHPQWYGLTVEDALSLPEAHAIEIYNHSCAVECDRGDGLVVLEEALARGRRLHALATDDAHFDSPDAGGGWVMVKAEALEPELLLEALKRGDFYSSQGPQIHAIAIEGDEAVVACSPVSAVVAVGTGTGSKLVHGQDLTRATVPLANCQGPYIRITVIDDKGRRAWSNPIWRAAVDRA
jgi:predicted metal-dependent phosphoesterase TrpH